MTMLPIQNACLELQPKYIPLPYRSWCNIKLPFNTWQGGGHSGGMATMLKKMDIELTGTHHRGIDDCRNIAKIVFKLLKESIKVGITSHLPLKKHPSLTYNLVYQDTKKVTYEGLRSVQSIKGRGSGFFKTNIKQVFRDSQEITEDSQLFDFQGAVTLRVE
eukprot:Lithocolla_globosa_v1_NODE_3786_length_1580_cov_16.880000.p1 type:complete len:161 gc:universal NODE_3786_length_1580_cov_16.880000:1174-692(-)